MEGLVNYSSEDEQDDYPYTKVAVRERGGGGSGGAPNTGRAATETSGSLKRSYEHSKSGSYEREASPYRKGREAGSDKYKSGNSNYYEDKYRIDRRADKSRDHRADKRDTREPRNNREARDEVRDYDNSHKYDYKKHDDHKHYRDSKRDYKRDGGNDYHRDDKRYNRYDDRKSTYNPNYKDRFNYSKSRYDERKSYDDHRINDDRRGPSNNDERRRDFNDKRNYNNEGERKAERRNNDERRPHRSYNEDRTNTYRSRRSNSPASTQRNNSNNKCSERKDDSNARRERKRHSRSRSRSRSRSADNSVESNIALNKNLNQRAGTGELLTEIKRPVEELTQTSEKKTLPAARNFESLLNLPLNENVSKHPNVVTVPAISTAPGLNTTTSAVQLPSYYNPNVINPNKYVEQMQKRKLIWGAKKTEDSASKWGHAQFSQDQDGKVASKFMRLMGIKSAGGGSGEISTASETERKSTSSTSPPNNTDVKTREAMFSTMEQQYEVARQVTHTMRGVGLGFGSQSRPY